MAPIGNKTETHKLQIDEPMESIKKYYNFEEVIKQENPLLYDEAFKQYRQDWMEIPKSRIVTDFPMHLDLEVTNVCNLRCVMCSRTHRFNEGTLAPEAHMDMDLFKRIIDEAEQNGCYALRFNGDSEPLILQDRFIEMLDYVSSKRFLDVFFGTNGTLLKPGISIKIIETGLTRMNVSFDSPEKETYEKIRIGANFDKVLNNIRKFMDMRNAMNRRLPFVRVQMVVMEQNKHQMADFKRLMGSIVDAIGFISYTPPFDFTHVRSLGATKKQFNPDFVCDYLYQRLYIKANGDVAACFMEMPDDANIIGNVKYDNLKSLWHGPFLTKLREFHETGRITEIDMCRRCGFPYKEVSPDVA